MNDFMNILNRKIAGIPYFLYIMTIVFFVGCSKPELHLSPYEKRDVERFDNLTLSGRQNSVLAQWDRLAAEDVDYILVQYMEETAVGEGLQTRRFARDRREIAINNLENFKAYAFTFMVIDKFGNTSDSIVASATPLAEVLNLFASGGDTEGSVDMIWDDPEDPFDVFTGVYFYDEQDGLLGSVDRGVQAITLTGLPPGEEVTITAKIKLGDDFSEGIDIVASPRVVLPPPGEVVDLLVKGKTNLLELTWENPTDESFSFVEIYWGIGTDQTQATTRFMGQAQEIPGGRMKAFIPNLNNGTQYVVVIKTSDIHGNASDGTMEVGTPKNTTHVGNITIGSMDDYNNYNEETTYIQGNLIIENLESIVDLDKFHNLDSISGLFTYKSNSSWDYLQIDDFENLQKVGGNLTFTSVWPAADVILPLLRHVGGDFIVSYTGLKSIAAPALERVSGQMYFLGGSALESLSFPALTRVDVRLLFANLPSIKNLDGFSALNYIGGDFVIGRDPWGATGSGQACGFTNICGVRPLMQTGTVTGNVVIEQTPLGTKTKADIVAGNCSQ